MKILKCSLRKIYGRSGDLNKHYGAPSPKYYMEIWIMTIYSETIHSSHITPPRHFVSELDKRLTFLYQISRGFYKIFIRVVACQHTTFTPPNTWSCPIFDLLLLMNLSCCSSLSVLLFTSTHSQIR